MNYQTRRGFWVSVAAILFAMRARAEEGNFKFYRHYANPDPPARGFELFSKGIKLCNDFAELGRRDTDERIVLLSMPFLRNAVGKACQEDKDRVVLWPASASRRLEDPAKANITDALKPIIAKGDPFSPQVYWESLIELLKKDGKDVVAVLLRKWLKELGGEIAFALAVAEIGWDYISKAYALMRNYYLAKPVLDCLDNSLTVHSFEIDIKKSLAEPVADGTSEGIWMSETVWFKGINPKPMNAADQFHYYPLWKGEYTAPVAMKDLLKA